MLQATINNYKFHYVENGNGENLVLVHGSVSDYRTWENQMVEFGKNYHCVAYSRRFHRPNEKIAESDDYSILQHVDDLEAFLQFLDNKPVHLLGHSYGGFICLLLAVENKRVVYNSSGKK